MQLSAIAFSFISLRVQFIIIEALVVFVITIRKLSLTLVTYFIFLLDLALVLVS